MPPFKPATAPPCKPRRAFPGGIAVSYGVQSEEHFHENTGKHHSIIIMAERKSDARIDWQDKDGNSGGITIRGQHVIFMHKQVSYSLHWKQEAVLIGLYLGNNLLHEHEAKTSSLSKVAHKPLWDLARYDCGIMGTCG